MDALEGIWRIVDSRAWDERTDRLRPSAPYGWYPMGSIMFAQGRMLVALCNSDADVGPDEDRGFSSYGGRYSFDGSTLECAVDIASDCGRIGSRQVRSVLVLDERQILVRPPPRLYGSQLERRELVWERVWRPNDDGSAAASPDE